MRRSFTNKLIIILVLGMSTLYSCIEEEEKAEPIKKVTPEQEFALQLTDEFSEAELEAALEEELELLESSSAQRVIDISGMDVQKDNPKKIYVHYMPWFQSKDHDGFWGQHWTMTNRNPDIIDENGKREIAAFYYPLIGPYSSKDPDLQEYHFMLMKLAGVDGVIFDWYCSRSLYDYGLLHESTETFMDVLSELDLDFAIMYEDRAAVHAANNNLEEDYIIAAQEDVTYMKENYFSQPNYIKHDGKDMLMVFGPHYITNEESWDEIFSVIPKDSMPDFLTIWAASDRVGTNTAGEFLWVAPDHLAAHDYYYATYEHNNKITIGGVYPGFESYYSTGGWSDGVNDWVIDHNSGRIFEETLNYTHHEQADFIQIITWNDFGEGTMIEPTEEFGFMYLQLLQQYTGVEFDANDFQMAVDLYKERKIYANNETAQRLLDRCHDYMKEKKFRRVRLVLNLVDKYFNP